MRDVQCDYCEKEIHWVGDLVEIRVPRPSDPTDVTCVMWSCTECTDPLTLEELERAHIGYAAALKTTWDEYVETETARKRGHLFLS